MDAPRDFNDPFYGHLREDVLNVLTGALGSLNISETSALVKIRQHCGAENGYSDDFVRSLSAFKSRFPKDQQPQAKPPMAPSVKPKVEDDKEDGDKKEGNDGQGNEE